MSSFSISEEFVRRLYFIRKRCDVADIRLLLDFKAMQKTVKLWHFLHEVVDHVYMGTNHSKVFLLEDPYGMQVSIQTSQNLTRGHRLESYLLSTDGALYTQFMTQLEYVIKHKTISLHDVIGARMQDH